MGSRRGAFIFWKGSGNRLQTRRRPPSVCPRARIAPALFVPRARAAPALFVPRLRPRARCGGVRRMSGGRSARRGVWGRPTQGGCTACLRSSFLDGWREWSVNSRPRKIRILKKADFSDIIDLTEYLPGAKCPADRKFRKKRRGSAKGDVFGRQSIHFQFERNKGE